MPVLEDGQGRMGCCGTMSPAPDGNTYHAPGCMAQRVYGKDKTHKFNKAGYERWRIVPRPVEPSPDFPTWTGMVAPNGDFYSCEYAGHRYLAEQICLTLKLKEEWKLPSETLSRLGWIEVHGANWKEKTEHFFYIREQLVKPTAKQLNTMFDLSVKYDNPKAYQEFVEIYG